MKQRASERGSALLLMTIVILILVGISGAYMTVSYFNSDKATRDADALKALYIAESAGALIVNYANHPPGSPNTPIRPVAVNTLQPFGGGMYLIPSQPVAIVRDTTGNVTTKTDPNWGTRSVADQYDFVDFATPPTGLGAGTDDNYVRLRVYGVYNGVTRKVEVLLSRVAGGAFWNAVYAGNSSGDTSYTLSFGGNQAAPLNDSVRGDMYSGQNFSATGTTSLVGENGTGNSTVTYKNNYSNTVGGATGVQGTQDPLDMQRSGNVTPWETKAINNRNSAGRVDSSDGIKYIDVAYDLTSAAGRGAATGTWAGSMANGGSATQINNASEPSHIFRKNPSTTGSSTTNRTQSYEYTAHAKDDYYLEDPTTSGRNNNTISPAINGDTTASGVNIQPNGNNAVYFIDGNMRISGEPTKSYQLTPASGTGYIQMTIIVKGNVSMTDNLLYPTYQSANDGVAIIAIQDTNYPNMTASNFMSGTATLPTASGLANVNAFVTDYNNRTQPARNAGKNVPALPTNVSTWTAADRERAAQEYNKSYGSGNVYFGDPGSGTVEHFEGFLYAENNFYATNLDSTNSSGGTQKVEVFGNMTAGNQVKIVRDTSGVNGSTYIPLKVTFDTKIKSNTSRPPALPSTPSSAAGAWFIATAKQVP